MRPKVSRGIKTTQSTKNLAILGPSNPKQSLPFQISQLNLQKLSNSTKQPPSSINTCRTEFSSKNYTSKNNQTDRERERNKKPLQPIYLNQYQNSKTYKEMQREKNTHRNSYMSRGDSNSKSRVYDDQQNRWKRVEKQYQEISTIEMEILQILEQENMELKENIAKMRKESQQKELSMQFLRTNNDDLQMKLFQTEKELGKVEELVKKREEESYQKKEELEQARKEIEEMRMEIEIVRSGHKNKQQAKNEHANKQTIFQQLNRLRDSNEILIRQQQGFKVDLRNIRKENVGYRRQIARLKRQLISNQDNWIQLGERSSIKIAEGIRLELKEFGDQRNKQYEQMLKHYKEEIDFLRERNSVLEGKLQNCKEKQIRELIGLKRSFEDGSGNGGRKSGEKALDRGQSVMQRVRHVKSRSMAMLTHLGRSEEDSY